MTAAAAAAAATVRDRSAGREGDEGRWGEDGSGEMEALGEGQMAAAATAATDGGDGRSSVGGKVVVS